MPTFNEDIFVQSNIAKVRIRASEPTANEVDDTDKWPSIMLDGAKAEVKVGGIVKPAGIEPSTGLDGRIVVENATGRQRVVLDGKTGTVALRDKDNNPVARLDADHGDLWLGGNSTNGTIRLFAQGVDNIYSTNYTISIDAYNGSIRAGGKGPNGLLILRNTASKEIVRIASGSSTATEDCTIHLNGADASIRAGSGGKNGKILVRNEDSAEIVRIASGPSTAAKDCTIHLNGADASIRAGSGGKDGKILVRNKDGEVTVLIDGEKGDVKLLNADCAEEFDTVVGIDAVPGSVLVINDDERLTTATQPYDRRVAGVVSGAGSYRPGIVLGRRQESANRSAIALVGKVFCLVDADHGPIHVGDLLVSSSTPGHAMVASDPSRTPGAVLGKALRAWPAGQGMIPILVSLQ